MTYRSASTLAKRSALSASPARARARLALTLLRVLPQAARIVSGHIWFEGEDLVRKSDAEMRQCAASEWP